MPDILNPYEGTRRKTGKGTSTKGGSKGSVNYQPPDQSNNPYGGFNVNAYNEWLQSQYGVQPFGQPQPGGKKRPPEPSEPVEYQPVPVQEFPYAPAVPYYDYYLQDTYGVQPFGQAPQQEDNADRPPIWYDPFGFGDPLGGEQVSRVPKGAPKIYDDPGFNLGVLNTGDMGYAGGYGYGYGYPLYYPRYRYGSYEQAKVWYNSMLNWKIS